MTVDGIGLAECFFLLHGSTALLVLVERCYGSSHQQPKELDVQMQFQGIL